MRNPLKENKGFIDHCIGGVWWMSATMFLYKLFEMGTDFIVTSIIIGCISALIVEEGQWVKATKITPRLKIDTYEDLAGEVSTGLLTWGGLTLLLNNSNFYQVTLILIVLSTLWLIYSAIYRWRLGDGE